MRFGCACGRAFPESNEVASRVVDAQMGDNGDQMVNVVAWGEISIFGVAQDRGSRNAASANEMKVQNGKDVEIWMRLNGVFF